MFAGTLKRVAGGKPSFHLFIIDAQCALSRARDKCTPGGNLWRRPQGGAAGSIAAGSAAVVQSNLGRRTGGAPGRHGGGATPDVAPAKECATDGRPQGTSGRDPATEHAGQLAGQGLRLHSEPMEPAGGISAGRPLGGR